MRGRSLGWALATVAAVAGCIALGFSLSGDPASDIHFKEEEPPHDDGGSPLDGVSKPTYTYRFPFGDGRRAEVPKGDLVKNVRLVYQEISETILETWGEQYRDTLFAKGMHFSDEGKVVEDKMLNAVVEQGGFVAAFTDSVRTPPMRRPHSGISVTAGHDCLYEQSYPIMLNATMSRLFAAAGVRFEAVNVAIGNTRVAPYSFCVDAHAGIDADIVSWEMSLEVPFTENQCAPAAEAMELFIRTATVLPRRPAVLILNAAPDQDFCASQKLAVIRRRESSFVGECDHNTADRSLMSAYRKFGLHEMYMNQLVPTYTCGDERFARNDLFREGKHFPKPMSWHPGPHAHALVADVLFMHYAHVFLSALECLEAAAQGITAQELRGKPDLERRSMKTAAGLEKPDEISGDGDVSMRAGRGDILPTPRWCAGWRFCDGAGNYRCSSTLFPLAGEEGSRLLDMVSASTPIVNGDKKQFVAEPKEGHWAVTLNEEKLPILAYMRQPAPSGMHKPIDRKWVLVGNKNSGPIEFEFETEGVLPSKARGNNAASAGEGSARAVEDSRVVVCRPAFIDRVPLEDAEGVRFSIDGVETSVSRTIVHRFMPAGVCVILAAEIGVGRHTLSVEPLRVSGPLVAVSHLIYPS